MIDADRPSEPNNPAQQETRLKAGRRRKCRDAAQRNKIIPFVLNKLSFEEEQKMTEHLCSCAACRKEVEELLQVVNVIHFRRDAAIRIVEDELVSREIVERAYEMVESEDENGEPDDPIFETPDRRKNRPDAGSYSKAISRHSLGTGRFTLKSTEKETGSSGRT